MRQTGYVRYEDLPLESSDGRLIDVEFVSNVYRVNSQRVIQCNIRDITERKQMEEVLIRTQRMRAVGELAAGVSHNLNNMLSTVLGPAQLLKRYTDDPRVHREADQIIVSSRRARDLVQRLNQSVRGEPEGTLYGVPIHEVVQQAVQASRPRWQDEAQAQGIAIEVVTDLEAVPDIRGTSTELHQVLLNLLFNAVEAMPEGGTITITTRPVEEGVRLTVADTGMGMDAETRQRVFEPLSTSKQDVGSGLGLATVHGVVRRWGGRIEVVSAPGQGATFALLLPVWTAPEAPAEEKATEVQPVARRGRLLIVEDDEAIRRLLERFLSKHHEVEMVLSGPEALERFAPDRYDVALIDLGLPGMPGDQVARQIQRLDPLVVAVLITGWDLKPDDPRLVPFDFWLQKPLADLDQLEATVARAVGLRDARATPR